VGGFGADGVRSMISFMKESGVTVVWKAVVGLRGLVGWFDVVLEGCVVGDSSSSDRSRMKRSAGWDIVVVVCGFVSVCGEVRCR
jgi:hypothetical protein